MEGAHALPLFKPPPAHYLMETHKGCGVRGSQLSADLTFRQGSWRWDWPWPILTGTHLVTRSTGHERRDGACGPCAPLSPDTGYATPLDFGRGAR